MTRLTQPLRRETDALYRGRALVVRLHPRYLEISEKGRRDSVTLHYEAAYECALKLKARRDEDEGRRA